MKFDVCIIGGGAAGLAAASALNKELNICIIEKNENPGRKIMATGGGRCNITNRLCDGVDETLGFFVSRGLVLYQDEEGRYYPYSNKASDVVEALLRSLGSKVKLFCGESAEKLTKGPEAFAVKTQKRVVEAERVIIAAGGKAAPQFGTAGDGYRLAKDLGHTTGRIYPILAGVECLTDPSAKKLFRELKGIRAKAAVKLLKKGQQVMKENGDPVEELGEIQFTEYGLSGICVFNLTPYIKADEGEDFRKAIGSFEISIDLAPDLEEGYLAGRTDTFGILTEKLSRFVGMEQLKDWRIGVSGVRGWREAQCTAGGVLLEEINMDTMESRLQEGLFLAGEVLDIQGPCGGFNLQNAWETGIRAAESINEKTASV